MLKGPGDFSPPDPDEDCPESCSHCPPSRDPKECPLLECIYAPIDKETLGDRKYHERF